MSTSELLVRGAAILDPGGPLRVADIRAEDGTITEVGPALRPGSAQVVEAEGMVAMPGLINAHTHSGQNLDRGTTPNLPLAPVADVGGVREVPHHRGRPLHAGHGRCAGNARIGLHRGARPRLGPAVGLRGLLRGRHERLRRRRNAGWAGPHDRRSRHLRHDVVRRRLPAEARASRRPVRPAGAGRVHGGVLRPLAGRPLPAHPDGGALGPPALQPRADGRPGPPSPRTRRGVPHPCA